MGKMLHNEARELLVESYEKRITPRRSLGHFRTLLRVPGKCRKMAKKLLHLLLICNFVRRLLQPKIRALMKKQQCDGFGL